MSPMYYIIAIVICLIAFIGTILVGKEMTKQSKEGTGKDELESLKSDMKGKSSIPLLSVIYSITGVITVILVWIFII